jgi:uncharacterized membrane protein YphA (DoxX/SURF4 family)
MRRLIDNDLLTAATRLVVGGIFIYSAYHKIIDPGEFARLFWNYHIVPGSLINLMALILPWVELLAGLGLIMGLFYRGAALLVNGMTVVFIIALTSAVLRDLNINCGCFGNPESAQDALIRDLGLLLLTLQIWFSRSRRWLCSRR